MGFDAIAGASGLSRTKHNNCMLDNPRWAGEKSNVTPAPFCFMRTAEIPPRPKSNHRWSSANPTFLRYQSTALSRSETNRLTSGVVGAADLQGPNCAAAGCIEAIPETTAKEIKVAFRTKL